MWLAAFSLAAGLLSCTPQLTQRNKELDRIPVTAGYPQDAESVRSSTGSGSIRGAAADETPGSESWQRRAMANARAIDYIRGREGPLYRRRDGSPSTDGLPQLCLALSGGGMRALAFDAGVLYGLQRRGLYRQVDVLSAVSGGGYASYWLIGSVGQGRSEEEVLSGAGSKDLARLRSHAGDLLTIGSGTGFVASLAAAGNAQRQGTPLAADFLATLTGKIEWIEAPGHMGYMEALDHMLLGVSPMSLLRSGLPSGRLRDMVESGAVPVPVWLATARPPPAPKCTGTDPSMELAERSRSPLYAAFEIGPTGMGSEELGFLTHMPLLPANAMTVSGAAMSIPFNEHCDLLQVVDASITVKNFPARREPGAPATGSRTNVVDSEFNLLDGGVVDNLGVFPLVRRLCSDIIVVDAGFDPYLTFDSYGYLKQQLSKLNVEISIPALEEIARHNTIPADGSNPPVPCRDGICLIVPRPECVRRDSSASCIASDQLPDAVFEGQIRSIPLALKAAASSGGEDWTFGERAVRVRYVKLSLDAGSVEQYPATVRERYRSDVRRPPSPGSVCTALRDTGACRFPHKPTADVDFRGGKFEAYWDLGRCILERDWDRDAHEEPTRACSESNWSSSKL